MILPYPNLGSPISEPEVRLLDEYFVWHPKCHGRFLKGASKKQPKFENLSRTNQIIDIHKTLHRGLPKLPSRFFFYGGGGGGGGVALYIYIYIYVNMYIYIYDIHV